MFKKFITNNDLKMFQNIKKSIFFKFKIFQKCPKNKKKWILRNRKFSRFLKSLKFLDNLIGQSV
jgi:hypothetical protein